MTNTIARFAIKAAKKVAFKLEKHAPEILIGAGIVTGVGATVLACKATIEAQEVLAKAKDDLDAVHTALEDPNVSEDTYNDEKAKRDTTLVYIQSAVKLAQMYAPAIVVGATSIACFIGSNRIMAKRLASVVAAYGALDQSFKKYRDRVREAIGPEKELEVYHGVKKLKNGTRDENGLVKIDDAKSKAVTVDGYSIYARCFDEYNPNYKDNAEYNLMVLRGIQRYLQACLERDGHLFLNDAYKELGMDISDAGQIVGWIYDPDNPNHKGDNAVSFGLYDPTGKSPALGDFINGKTNSVFLDFNVDGVIIDKI